MATMGDAELLGLPAVDLAAAIAARKVSAARAVDACIKRIDQVNPALNAVVSPRFALARAEAVEADRRQADGAVLGALHGVPVTIKDCIDVAGLPSTFGLAGRAHILAEHDDAYVARLRAAGAIVIGKTNVAQALLAYESHNPLFGRTANPWDTTRSSGGSSGGEAAIIAARGSFLGLGTDIAGSVRVPAAFTGLASLKPTTGRMPDAGRFGPPFGQQAVPSQIGVLARTVPDVALGYATAHGDKDPGKLPALLADWRAVDVGALRVAVYEDDGTFTPSSAACRAVRVAADILAQHGAHVTRWSPPDVGRALAIFVGILSADGARGLSERFRGETLSPTLSGFYRLMRAPRVLLSLLERAGPLIGAPSLARAVLPHIGFRDTHRFWQLVEAQADYSARFARALDTDPGGPFDLIVTPACGVSALPHGEGANLGFIGAYSALYNLLGYPAGIVPVSRVQPDEQGARPETRDATLRSARRVEHGSAGLPVGVQIVARPWHEHISLAAMNTIETAARARVDFPHAPRDASPTA